MGEETQLEKVDEVEALQLENAVLQVQIYQLQVKLSEISLEMKKIAIGVKYSLKADDDLNLTTRIITRK